MQTKGEQTRDRILTETTRLILQKGLGATSVSDVLAASGVKKGSLYFHFASKEEIGLAVLARAKKRFLTFLDASLTGPTPGAMLDNFFSRAFANHHQAGFVGGCIFGNTALEASDSCDSFTAVVDEVFEEWTGRLQQVIEAAQTAGQVRSDLPAQMLACHVVAAVEGGIMLSRLKKDGLPLKNCLESLRALLQLTP